MPLFAMHAAMPLSGNAARVRQCRVCNAAKKKTSFNGTREMMAAMPLQRKGGNMPREMLDACGNAAKNKGRQCREKC